jgi:MinD-like ATPase involved in chromosome partitioning or flagellar assembly
VRSTASSTAYGDPRRALPTPLPDGTESDRTESEVSQGPGATTKETFAGPHGATAGRVVAVWGPAGAPGRTTTAVGLATEVASAGGSCLLVDADTYAGSVAQVLGLLDEAPGLATAARAADHGTLDVRALSALASQVSPGLRVLTGLSSASRWPEIRPASFATVLRMARELTGWTVVDTSSSLEQDEELSYDTAAPRRNGVTLQALQDADVVVAVGSADPVGLQRLVRGLQDLAAVGATSPVVVVNRVRASAVGPGPERAVRRALARFAGVNDPLLVPYDRPGLDAAVLQGRTLAEAAPSSPVRAAHMRLATRLGAPPTAVTRPVLRGLRRRLLGAGALG